MGLIEGCAEPAQVVKQAIRPMPVFVVPGDNIGQRSFAGRARAVREANLAVRVSGPLVELPAKIGNKVNAGDVLAVIDPQDYETGLVSAKGTLAQAESELEFARREYQRSIDIKSTDPNLISPSQLDAATRNVKSAEATLMQAQAALKQASDNLAYTKLRAPFKGQVTDVLVENFEEVSLKQVVVRILDTSSIEMVVDIPEQLISQANNVIDIQVRFDAFPNTLLPAEIKEVGSEADSVTRTYPVTLRMAQPKDIQILPGMAGRASGKVRRPTDEGKVYIPIKALGKDSDGQSFVWRVDANGVLSKVVLSSASIVSGKVLIEGPITAGDSLALAGIYRVTEGQAVNSYDAGVRP